MLLSTLIVVFSIFSSLQKQIFNSFHPSAHFTWLLRYLFEKELTAFLMYGTLYPIS